jgi:hypothetical protein
MQHDVFVALEKCGCIVAADTTGEDVADWVRSGLKVEMRSGLIAIPAPCCTHAKPQRPATPVQDETKNTQVAK